MEIFSNFLAERPGAGLVSMSMCSFHHSLMVLGRHHINHIDPMYIRLIISVSVALIENFIFLPLLTNYDGKISSDMYIQLFPVLDISVVAATHYDIHFPPWCNGLMLFHLWIVYVTSNFSYYSYELFF